MSTLSLAAYCALIVFQLRHDPSLSAINPFLFGKRYIVFPTFFVFLLSPLILIAGARVLGCQLVLPVAILTTAASVATYVFFTTIAALWPIFAAPFPMTWHQVVSDARIQLEAGGYVRDRNLSKLYPEFHAELSQFRGLLDHELGCHHCARFSPAQAPSSVP